MHLTASAKVAMPVHPMSEPQVTCTPTSQMLTLSSFCFVLPLALQLAKYPPPYQTESTVFLFDHLYFNLQHRHCNATMLSHPLATPPSQHHTFPTQHHTFPSHTIISASSLQLPRQLATSVKIHMQATSTRCSTATVLYGTAHAKAAALPHPNLLWHHLTTYTCT